LREQDADINLLDEHKDDLEKLITSFELLVTPPTKCDVSLQAAGGRSSLLPQRSKKAKQLRAISKKPSDRPAILFEGLLQRLQKAGARVSARAAGALPASRGTPT
jgi:hypothetical protein